VRPDDRGVLADLYVGQRRVRADRRTAAGRGRAVQLDVRQQGDVAGQLDGPVHPGRVRVDDGDAFAHQLVEGTAVQLGPERGQLDAVVDALGLHRVVGRVRTDPLAVLPGDGQHVGQVELALRVVGGDPAQAVAQRGRVEGVDPGVDLVDLPLLRRRVLVLDDPGDRAVVTRDDPPVPGRVGHPRGQHGHRIALLVVRGDQLQQRLRLQQRHVTRRHHDRAVEVRRYGAQAGPDRVTGAQLLLLDGGLHSWVDVLEVRLDQLAAVADHDHQVLRVECTGGDHGVPDETAPADLVQHLRGRRFHPGSQTGGHDHDRRGTMGSHAVFSSSSLRVSATSISTRHPKQCPRKPTCSPSYPRPPPAVPT
jgi:hypothetical protein